MRVVSGPQLAILNGATHNVYAKLEIKNASGTWKDYTALAGKDYFLSATVSTDVDSPVWSLSGQLKRDGEAATESLSPLRGDSTLNVDDTLAPAPAINAAREWRISVNVTAAGVAPAPLDWRELCAGFLDKPDFTADPMVIEGRSVGARLMDTTALLDATYSGAFEDVAQQYVNDNIPDSPPTLYIPSPPAFTLTKFRQFHVSVMDGLVTLALAVGYMVRDVYHPGTGQMVTAIIDPGRARAVDATLSPTVYRQVDQASLDVASIRNVIEGEYVNGVTGEVGSIIVRDTSSIAAFGGIPRYMKFSEDATSPIDTGNEMLDMVNAALADLSTPKFDHTVTSTLFWPAEIADRYEFTGNAVHYDTAQTLAVVGITHTLERGHGSTQFVCRGSPSGAFMEWIRRQGTGPSGPAIPPSPTFSDPLGEAMMFGSVNNDGSNIISYTFNEGVDAIRLFAEIADGSAVPVPDATATTLAAEIRRPEGDIGNNPNYSSVAVITARERFWKRYRGDGERGGLTSPPWISNPVQAVDPIPAITRGTLTSLTIARTGDTENTVTVTPASVDTSADNFVVVMRNEHELPPIGIGTSTAPVVFLDTGLDLSNPQKSFTYDAFILSYKSGGAVTGQRFRTVTNNPAAADVPVWAQSTPLAVIQSNVPKVQLSWTATTPGAGGVRVEASLDRVNKRIVGAGALASGTVYDDDPTPKLYRLVAYVVLTGVEVAASEWKWFTGQPNPLSNPGAVPQFVNGTPKVVMATGFPLPTIRLRIEWVCAVAAAQIAIQRSTAGAGGPFVDVLVTSAVSSGGWTDPDSTDVTLDAWYRLVARNLLSGVVATSAVVHYVP